MGEKEGSWKQCFCCAGPPQTKSSISININNVEPEAPAEEAKEIKQQIPEDVYAEVQVQTSYVEIPPGDRWRWSRLQTEVQVQTSYISLPDEETIFPFETDAQVQTSYVEIPPQDKWRWSRLQTEAQVQTSNLELSGEQTFLPFEREAQVQTSYLEAPEETSLPLQTEAQVQTSHIEVLHTETLFPIESEPQEKTSDLDFQDIQVKNLFPLFVDVEVQTSYVDIPAGNNWRSSRLQAEAQVQTSNHDLLKTLSSLSQKKVQVQTSKLALTEAEEVPLSSSLTDAQVQTSKLVLTEAEEVPLSPSLTEAHVQTSKLAITEMEEEAEEASFPTEEKPIPTTQSEAAMQTSYVDLPAGNKWRWSCPEAEAQMQTPITELLKKLSSPSLTEAQVQTSKLAVTEAKEEEAPFQVEEKHLTKNVAEAAVQTSYVDLPAGNNWRSSRLQAEAQVQTSHIELLKEPSSPSLSEAQVQTSKLSITEAETAFPYPSQTEVHMQSSYLEVLEVEDEVSSTPIKEKPMPPTLMEAQTQTSCVDVPAGNKWYLSQLRADAQVQTTRLKLPEGKEKSSSPSQTQTEMLTIEVEVTEENTALLTPPDVKILEKEELKEEVALRPPSPEYAVAQVQTSLVEIPLGKKWRSSRLCTEAQVQTSHHEVQTTKSKTLPPQGTRGAKKVTERAASKKLAKAPTQATPVSVHLHVKMTPQRWNGNKKN